MLLKLSHELFQALHRLNQEGIVHHLLSPNQIMLTDDLHLLLAGAWLSDYMRVCEPARNADMWIL